MRALQLEGGGNGVGNGVGDGATKTQLTASFVTASCKTQIECRMIAGAPKDNRAEAAVDADDDN